MTTLLIGGTGFLGRAVVPRLLRTGPVRVFARPTSSVGHLPSEVEVVTGDLNERAAIERGARGASQLVYCASMGFGQVPPLVACLRETSVARVLFTSTTAIFTSLPAQSRAVRLEAEAAVRDSGLSWTILRPTMIYGDRGDRNMSRLLNFLRRSPLFPIFGSGLALQQPVLVDDVADAVLAALHAEACHQRAYNVPGEAPLSYRDLVRTAAAAIGRAVRLVHLPMRPIVLFIRLMRALHVSFPHLLSPEQVLRLGEDKVFSYADAARDFGFRPRSFAEGVNLEAKRLGLQQAETLVP